MLIIWLYSILVNKSTKNSNDWFFFSVLIYCNVFKIIIEIDNLFFKINNYFIGENGYFRISMGNNMCGIGTQAFYLCPDSVCSNNNINIYTNNIVNLNSNLPGIVFVTWLNIKVD